jgi:hypothetical protein
MRGVRDMRGVRITYFQCLTIGTPYADSAGYQDEKTGK